MADNNNTKWTEALPFVQFAKNCAYHSGIRQCPYEAMFGTRPRRGLASLPLPRENLQDINTEEELEEALNTAEVFQVRDADDPSPPPSPNAAGSTEPGDESSNPPPADDASPYERLLQHRATMMRKRKAAEENLKVQAQKMLKTSNEKFPPANVGDTVRVKVPDVDRGRTDARNIIAVITDVEDGDF